MNAVATPTKPTETVAAPILEPLSITLMDVCDPCGFSKDERVDGSVEYNSISQAFVAVRTSTGGVLYFCGHHYKDHEAKFAELGYEVLDKRGNINEKPMSGQADTPGQEAANLG